MKSIKLPKKDVASKLITARFTVQEFAEIQEMSVKSGVKPGTLIRAIVTQMIRAGIQVN